jgi:hypothetical protein
VPAIEVTGDLCCWTWTGRTTPDGTPTIRTRTRTTTARRYYWERDHGPIPEGKVLFAMCRNTLCVRPRHMDPIDPAEIPERVGLRVLTPEQAKSALLMRKHASRREVARRFGVDPETIAAIERGTHWTVREKERYGRRSRQAA